MAKESNLKYAKKNYKTLCKWLKEKKLDYEKDDDNLRVTVTQDDEQETIHLHSRFNIKLGIVSVISSPNLGEIPESKRALMAAFIALINSRLVDGSFDYNPTSGRIVFRIVTSFIDSELDSSLFDYMFSVAYQTAKTYDVKLWTVANQNLTKEQLSQLVDGGGAQ